MKKTIEIIMFVTIAWLPISLFIQNMRCPEMTKMQVLISAPNAFFCDWQPCIEKELPTNPRRLSLPIKVNDCRAWLKWDQIQNNNYPLYIQYSFTADLYLVDTCQVK